MFIRSSCCLLLLFATVAAGPAQGHSNKPWSGNKSDWMGFTRYDFSVEGRRCWVVTPHSPAEGRPWVWRARFFGHQPQADIALLREGFHITYCDVAGLFGSPRAVGHWNAFYQRMTQHHGLSHQPALEGMSRGGLLIYNWAIANPQKVACLYGDAPVCDFKSWPGGRGTGKGSRDAWKKCLQAYDLTEAEALAYRGNPVDQLAPLARAGVPLLHVVGDADVVVPVEENTALIESRYQKLGGSIQVIHKAGVGHHPHALKDPGPIVSFILKHTLSNIRRRGNLDHARRRFTTEKRGHVAFIGGSITEMNGYRPMVCESLKKRFPETTFQFTAAGIASTCSTTGAFRLQDDVLNHGPVDLFFIEYAVNDDGDAGHARRECIRGMEGIIRQALRHNPHAALVITHFVSPRMLQQLQAGQTPISIRAHNDVAAHYGIATIHLAKEVAEQISAKQITWQQYGGTHPSPRGNRLCATMIDQLLDAAWSQPLAENSPSQPTALPTQALDSLHYGNGRFIALNLARFTAGWQIRTPQWNELAGQKRGRFTTIPLLCSARPGDVFTLAFHGTAVGAYLLAGPDAGTVEARIDDGTFQSVSLYHRFSKGLHYPRTVLFATDLSSGNHLLTVRISAETKSTGNAVRIIKFVAN